MAVAFDGSTGYLEFAGRIVSSFPCSMLCWVARDGNVVDDTQMWGMQGQSNADRYIAFLETDPVGVGRRAVVRQTGNSFFASTGSGATTTDATLRLAVAVFTSTTSRKLYFNSATPGGEDTATVTDDLTNHDRIVLGGRRYNGGGFAQPLNGALAEFHFYNVALSDANVTSILGGATPESISGWVDGWTLLNATSLTSIGGTRTLTLTGGVTTSGKTHPVSRGGGGSGVSAVPLRSFPRAILNH